jgi:hypothetical protein
MREDDADYSTIPHMRFGLSLPDNDVFSRSALEGWGARADPSFTMSNRPSAMSAWPEFCLFPRIASPAAPLAPQNAKVTDRTEAFGFYDLCVVEPDGIEPTTSCLQSTRSTN